MSETNRVFSRVAQTKKLVDNIAGQLSVPREKGTGAEFHPGAAILSKIFDRLGMQSFDSYVAAAHRRGKPDSIDLMAGTNTDHYVSVYTFEDGRIEFAVIDQREEAHTDQGTRSKAPHQQRIQDAEQVADRLVRHLEHQRTMNSITGRNEPTGNVSTDGKGNVILRDRTNAVLLEATIEGEAKPVQVNAIRFRTEPGDSIHGNIEFGVMREKAARGKRKE